MHKPKNIVWESPPIVKQEFRLYYDDAGRVLFYTCDKPVGKYIVIDSHTFAQGRPDVRVIEGKLVMVSSGAVVSKLMEDNQGIACAAEDISIVADESFIGKIIKWKLKTHAL